MPSSPFLTRTLRYVAVIISLGFVGLEVSAQTIKYKYDALGRVRVVEDGVNGNRGYDYDAAGNRINVLGPDSVAPSNPSALVVQTVTGSSAVISWTASTDNVGVSNYEYSLNGGAWIVNGSTTVNLTGLTPNTNYSFAVRAKDASNNPSGAASTSFKTKLNAPTGLSCYQSNGPTAWRGSWSAVAGANHYVFRLADNYIGSYTPNEPNGAIRVYGTLTNVMSINTSTKPCKWVQACDANNNCSAQAYF